MQADDLLLPGQFQLEDLLTGKIPVYLTFLEVVAGQVPVRCPDHGPPARHDQGCDWRLDIELLHEQTFFNLPVSEGLTSQTINSPLTAALMRWPPSTARQETRCV